MPYGITETGFNRKPLAEILSDKDDEVREIFGEKVNLSPQSAQGQVNGVLSDSDSNLWLLAQSAYDSFNPSAARGVPLSNLVQLNGIQRKAATASLVELNFTGIENTVIPAGSLFSTSYGARFSSLLDVTIVGGVATVAAEATEAGETVAIAGTITAIVTAVSGLATVNNLADATLGASEETDEELRARRVRSVAAPGTAMLDSIYGDLANIDNVGRLAVLENDSATTDADGNLPHSIHAILEGGADAEIAQAIYLRKAGGITMNGNTTVQVLDSQGIPHEVKFTRPIQTDIHVRMALTTGATFPADGEAQIKQAIIDFAAGDLVTGCEFGIGDDIIYSRLFTPINSIKGHQVDSLSIDFTASPAATANLPISFDSVGNFMAGNIVIDIT